MMNNTNKDNGVANSLSEKVTGIDHKVKEYNKKLDALPEDVRNEYKQLLNELNRKNDTFRNKLDDYKNTTEAAYEDVQIGLEMAWDDLTIAFNSVKERLDKLTKM